MQTKTCLKRAVWENGIPPLQPDDVTPQLSLLSLSSDIATQEVDIENYVCMNVCMYATKWKLATVLFHEITRTVHR